MSDTGLTGSLVPGVMVAADDDVTVGLVPPGKAPYHIVHRPESSSKFLSDPFTKYSFLLNRRHNLVTSLSSS